VNLSHPADPSPQPPANPPDQKAEDSDQRLVKPLRVSKKMRSFAHRMRMRSEDIDITDPASASEFECCSEIMRNILTKKKISKKDADRIMALTFDAAADHQLESFRRDRFVDDLDRSKKDLQRLIKQIDLLAKVISELPPISIGKLNKIIAKQNLQHFDTEMFFELMQATQDALFVLSPANAANKARSAIVEKTFRGSRDPVVTQVERTAPPAMTELWEIMPAETRRHIEAEIQRWTPPKRGQVRSFLNYLVTLLRKYRPKVKTRRRPSIKRRYLQRVGKVWRSSGLNVGRAHNGAKIESVESPFQHFARLALLAVGDSSGISVRQIVSVQSKLRLSSDTDRK
jgi:hypothetical protein